MYVCPIYSYNGSLCVYVCVCVLVCVRVRACMRACVYTAKTFMYHNLQLHNYQVEQNNARFNTTANG